MLAKRGNQLYSIVSVELIRRFVEVVGKWVQEQDDEEIQTMGQFVCGLSLNQFSSVAALLSSWETRILDC